MADGPTDSSRLVTSISVQTWTKRRRDGVPDGAMDLVRHLEALMGCNLVTCLGYLREHHLGISLGCLKANHL